MDWLYFATDKKASLASTIGAILNHQVLWRELLNSNRSDMDGSFGGPVRGRLPAWWSAVVAANSGSASLRRRAEARFRGRRSGTACVRAR